MIDYKNKNYTYFLFKKKKKMVCLECGEIETVVNEIDDSLCCAHCGSVQQLNEYIVSSGEEGVFIGKRKLIEKVTH
jgi:hypothetical protein